MQSDATQTSTVLTFFHTFLVMADVASVALMLNMPVPRKRRGRHTAHRCAFAFSRNIVRVEPTSLINLSRSPPPRPAMTATKPMTEPYAPSIPSIFVAGKLADCMNISSPTSCRTNRVDWRMMRTTPIVASDAWDLPHGRLGSRRRRRRRRQRPRPSCRASRGSPSPRSRPRQPRSRQLPTSTGRPSPPRGRAPRPSPASAQGRISASRPRTRPRSPEFRRLSNAGSRRR